MSFFRLQGRSLFTWRMCTPFRFFKPNEKQKQNPKLARPRDFDRCCLLGVSPPSPPPNTAAARVEIPFLDVSDTSLFLSYLNKEHREGNASFIFKGGCKVSGPACHGSQSRPGSEKKAPRSRETPGRRGPGRRRPLSCRLLCARRGAA